MLSIGNSPTGADFDRVDFHATGKRRFHQFEFVADSLLGRRV
jgi:hypothetical protein